MKYMMKGGFQRVLVFFLGKDIVRGAELLDGRIVQTGAFLHLGSNQQTFAFDLGHFRLDVPAASDCQGVGRDVAGVQTEHAGDGIPEDHR